MNLKILQKGFNFSQDGPGNRLVYHLQGCNFCCPWCSNPESININGSYIFTDKEINCPCGGETDAIRCAECENKICLNTYSAPIKLSYKIYEVDEIVDEALKSRAMFFDGGGVTLTGGEPTVQYEAVYELLKKLKENNIHTAIETNGSSPLLPRLCEYIDFLIVDLKHYDENVHKKITGASNKITKDNLRHLKDRQILVRIPLINGFNSSANDAENFAEFFKKINGENLAVEVLTYHEFGKEKWEQIGLKYKMKNAFVRNEEYEIFKNILENNHIKTVRT